MTKINAVHYLNFKYFKRHNKNIDIIIFFSGQVNINLTIIFF